MKVNAVGAPTEGTTGEFEGGQSLAPLMKINAVGAPTEGTTGEFEGGQPLAPLMKVNAVGAPTEERAPSSREETEGAGT
jgi:hypothetical protein